MLCRNDFLAYAGLDPEGHPAEIHLPGCATQSGVSRGHKGRLLVARGIVEIHVRANLFPLDGSNGAKLSVYMWGKARGT
jgi:hypothetical protein